MQNRAAKLAFFFFFLVRKTRISHQCNHLLCISLGKKWWLIRNVTALKGGKNGLREHQVEDKSLQPVWQRYLQDFSLLPLSWSVALGSHSYRAMTMWASQRSCFHCPKTTFKFLKFTLLKEPLNSNLKKIKNTKLREKQGFVICVVPTDTMQELYEKM